LKKETRLHILRNAINLLLPSNVLKRNKRHTYKFRVMQGFLCQLQQSFSRLAIVQFEKQIHTFVNSKANTHLYVLQDVKTFCVVSNWPKEK